MTQAIKPPFTQQRSGDAEIAQFKVGNKWTAYVQPTGDFIIRNEARRTICRGNLHTGEETVPLSEDSAGELEKMLVEREHVPQQNRQRLCHLSNSQLD
ncbi:hypothetical protein ACKFKG_23325 [Phormidesmis sp. 146-35]